MTISSSLVGPKNKATVNPPTPLRIISGGGSGLKSGIEHTAFCHNHRTYTKQQQHKNDMLYTNQAISN
jgi:hypothetical protein